ncbi:MULTISPECIES: PadR family transcriptional regulator [Paenibacillus]|uniref:PadR family transcriptional regulator n=1 Tax=Paenibacillus TaxID=44249 RepID=UPI0022B873B4|nr:PadR family transcriptional regulator [Paenibacillus caseinilyticus]MCZ8519477.1 PadR family transcriptional regulator [Paenibacillus caseinilyticus]
MLKRGEHGVTEWTSQIRRGILELCILHLIEQKTRYGYDILHIFQQWESLTITDGTVYPLLRRLQKENYIESYWQQSSSGPPRKYYRITPDGVKFMKEMTNEWESIVSSVHDIKSGNYKEDYNG